MHLKIVKSLLSLTLLSSTLLYAEFGVDDAPPANDYYDTQRDSYNAAPQKRSIPAKQVIIENRKAITALKRRVSELEERLSGMTSVIEGLNVTIAELKTDAANASSLRPADSSENTKLLKELAEMIDKINASYVSKEELQSALQGKKIEVAKKSSVKKNQISDSLDGKPTSKIYSEGVRLFVKQRYDEAAKRFAITDKKGYKPAASNYYLGETAYYTKQYEDAIFYYKKSAGLYDQASYMDVLLLHTAISLEKTGDKAQAKTFYKNIIDNYPDKKSTQIAKNKLKKLQ